MTDAPVISDNGVALARPEHPLDNGHLWSFPDFARRYLLQKSEENRLLTLFRPFPPFNGLLSTAEYRQPA